jgi:hypothetical protein
MPQSTKRPTVIVTRKLPDVVETRMRELFDARLNVDDAPMSQAQLVEAAQAADVLVPTVTERIDRGVLAQAGPRLKLIANFGTGVDNVDLATARNPLEIEREDATLEAIDFSLGGFRLFTRLAFERAQPGCQRVLLCLEQRELALIGALDVRCGQRSDQQRGQERNDAKPHGQLSRLHWSLPAGGGAFSSGGAFCLEGTSAGVGRFELTDTGSSGNSLGSRTGFRSPLGSSK